MSLCTPSINPPVMSSNELQGHSNQFRHKQSLFIENKTTAKQSKTKCPSFLKLIIGNGGRRLQSVVCSHEIAKLFISIALLGGGGRADTNHLDKSLLQGVITSELHLGLVECSRLLPEGPENFWKKSKSVC